MRFAHCTREGKTIKSSIFTLKKTQQLQPAIWDLEFAGDTSAITAPGQFVNIALPGKFLRRPISVCNWWEGGLNLLVKEAGDGTRELVRMEPGTRLEMLTGLGNGFDLAELEGQRVILAGGGIGIAPLWGLARCLKESKIRVSAVVLGFRTGSEAFYVETFRSTGLRVLTAAEDGSLDVRGTAADAVRTQVPEGDYVLACGPLPMLKSVWELPQLKGGQFSFEARMACGFGACMGCTIPTKNGPRRVCKDGPVFRKEEILWQI